MDEVQLVLARVFRGTADTEGEAQLFRGLYLPELQVLAMACLV